MNEAIYLPLATLVLGLVGGYYLGRYQAALIKRIHELEEATPYEPEPVVTMGAYSEPKELNETDTAVGLVQTKTPQRLDWENEIAVEKEGRGFVGTRG